MNDEPFDLPRLVAGASRWMAFEEGIRAGNRVVPPDPEFTRRLLKSAASKVHERSKGEEFFRARIVPHDFGGGDEGLRPEQMGAPPPYRAIGGRLNPDGIPYLYLASDHQTAIAEVRPWKTARVCVARFCLARAVRIVDLLREDVSPPDRPLHWLAFMATRPVHREDRHAYRATQHVAELIKGEGFDGLAYRSAVSPSGFNLALFDPASAMCIEVRTNLVHSVRYETEEIDPEWDPGEHT